MQSEPELKFVVEETRGTLDVFKLWVPRLALVTLFVIIGYTKFNSDPRSEWVRIFEQIGLGQWFRYFTAVVQVTGALFMLIPRTLTIGAAMLGCTMVGAMFVDVFVAHMAVFALFPFALLGAVASVWFAGRFGVA